MAETKTLQLNEDLNLFIDALLAQKGLTDLPYSLHEKLREELYVRLEQWLLAEMLLHVPDNQAPKLEKFIETGPEQAEITSQLRTIIPNYEDVYINSLLRFKETYLGQA